MKIKISSKTLYKWEIESTKKTPIIIVLMYIIYAIFSYYGYEIEEFSFIGGASLLLLGKEYLSSFTYKLCTHHRMFIYYVFIQIIIQYIDLKIGGIPVSDRSYLVINLALFGISTFLYIIFKRKYDFSIKNRSKISERYS